MKTYKINFYEQKQQKGERVETHRTARCILPENYLKEIGIDKDNRFVNVDLEGQKIVITKSVLND